MQATILKYLILSFFIPQLADAQHPDSVKRNGDTTFIYNKQTQKTETFIRVEKMPTPGYNVNEYLSKNLHYPDNASKNKIEGKVFVKFMVDKRGKIKDVHIDESRSQQLDFTNIQNIASGQQILHKEAIRVIKGMPDWRPGMADGKFVDVYYTLPINFRLPKATNTE